MKVLFITQYFYPEVFRGNDIAFDLVKRGVEVTVVTAIPNYPGGSFFKGYGLFRKRKETIQGVKVIRIPVFPRGKGGKVQLLLNYFSFAFFASAYTIYLAFTKKFTCCFIQQLSPVTLALPAVVYKKIRKIPIYTWVLDLWPESLTSAGGVTNKYVLAFFDQIVKSIYRNSDRILISSQRFSESIKLKGNFEDRLIYFPNWAEEIFTQYSNFTIPELPIGFKVVFAGNIGESQDFESIIKAAVELKEMKDIKFIIIGDGRKKQWVDDCIKKEQLEETVFTLGRYSLESMPAFFVRADAMLLTLKDELVFNQTVPAKLQAYMAAGKPVIAMLNGEGTDIINKANCGYTTNAGDYKNLAGIIQKMKDLRVEEREYLGENGKKYCELNFSKKTCLNNLYNIIR